MTFHIPGNIGPQSMNGKKKIRNISVNIRTLMHGSDTAKGEARF